MIYRFFHQSLLGIALFVSCIAFSQSRLPQFGQAPISQVVKAMTLEEKVRLVVGKGMALPGPTSRQTDQTPDKVSGISGHTRAIPRLGIPSLGFSDGPAGINRFLASSEAVKKLFSTAWPVGTLLASSWDTALVKRMGSAYGEEIRDYGIDFILAPGANLHRNPLGGRNFEYYSEDPLISGKIAAAIISGIQAKGVGATIKHFAVNNQESNRNTVNAIVSERALRELYLRNFEIAIRNSQPWAVMSAYNLVNGTYTSESKDLLTDILRKEWGYKGFVMTDWFGGKDAVAQLKAGNDLLMPGTSAQEKTILEAVKSGQLSEAVLDQNVSAILQVMLKTPSFKNYAFSNQPDLKKNAQVSREVAAESMVLLQNSKNALPLKDTSKAIALFGNHGYDLIAGGTGSGDVSKAYTISLAEGLQNAGYQLENVIAQVYKTYLTDYRAKHPKKAALMEIMNPTPFAPEYTFSKDSIAQIAATADVAIFYVGRNAGEGNDRKVADDYELKPAEKEQLNRISEAFHAKGKPVIAVLNIGGVIDSKPLREKADAILLAWQPGLEGGNAIADVLSGKINPSGKLATTFPALYSDEPTAKNFPGKEFRDKATQGMFGQPSYPAEVTHEEGIYVGYRYFNSFGVKPAYPFGYGLSYTTFSYNNLKLSSPTFKGNMKATVTITNTGNVPGKEVVQLYLSAPQGKLDKPSEELKGFAKTALLKPGASETITFTLTAKDLASFNTAQSAWIADAGNYTVKVGASSQDIKQTKPFVLAKDIVVEKVNKALVPQTVINELKKQHSQAQARKK